MTNIEMGQISSTLVQIKKCELNFIWNILRTWTTFEFSHGGKENTEVDLAKLVHDDTQMIIVGPICLRGTN
jgi:hypothetical protein